MVMKNLKGKGAKEYRQLLVSKLWSQGLRPIEITRLLAEETVTKEGNEYPNPHYFVNPTSGKPYNKSTISRDLSEISERWLSEVKENVDSYSAFVLAGYMDVYREARDSGELRAANDSLNNIVKLLGLAQPAKQEHRWETTQFKDLKEISDAQLLAIATGGGAGAAQSA